MFKRGKVLCSVIVSHLRAVLIHHKNRFFADINVLRIVVLDVRDCELKERVRVDRVTDRSCCSSHKSQLRLELQPTAEINIHRCGFSNIASQTLRHDTGFPVFGIPLVRS